MSPPPELQRVDPASADEILADDARRRLRDQGIVAIEPDERIGVLLTAGERVVAVRRGVFIERRKGNRDPEAGLRGDLYVTTSRLLCLGAVPVEVPLVAIQEAVVARDALRLLVGGGHGIEIRTAHPILLRVQIAAVREAVHADTVAGSEPDRQVREARDRA